MYANPPSSTLLDTSAPQAPSANQDAPDTAGRSGTHFLQIGVPAPLALVVSMADVIADRGAFAANRAMSHRNFSLFIPRLAGPADPPT